jgi:hypothetical protein
VPVETSDKPWSCSGERRGEEGKEEKGREGEEIKGDKER